MKEKIVTQYSCDFCKKKLIKKDAMVLHELSCVFNPINIQPCMNCRYL